MFKELQTGVRFSICTLLREFRSISALTRQRCAEVAKIFRILGLLSHQLGAEAHGRARHGDEPVDGSRAQCVKARANAFSQHLADSVLRNRQRPIEISDSSDRSKQHYLRKANRFEVGVQGVQRGGVRTSSQWRFSWGPFINAVLGTVLGASGIEA